MWPARLSDKQRQGRLGEQRALDYLRQRGLTLVEENFSCKAGEIDLIMRQGNTVVFVEVRQRAGTGQVAAAASITPAKIRRISRAAEQFLARYPQMPECRIDVVAIDGDALEWLPNAVDV